MRILLAVIIVALAFPAGAKAKPFLSKRDARAGAAKFMDKFAWSYDQAQEGEKVHVRPARFCKRVSRVTVRCPVTLTLVSTPTTLRGHIRVHRTQQGLLGYLLPWDPMTIAHTLGKATSAKGTVETVQIGVK